MDGLCFRFPTRTIVDHVVHHLRLVHPGASVVPIAECVHVSDATWRAPLVPEILVGSLGRLVACDHATVSSKAA